MHKLIKLWQDTHGVQLTLGTRVEVTPGSSCRWLEVTVSEVTGLDVDCGAPAVSLSVSPFPVLLGDIAPAEPAEEDEPWNSVHTALPEFGDVVTLYQSGCKTVLTYEEFNKAFSTGAPLVAWLQIPKGPRA